VEPNSLITMNETKGRCRHLAVKNDFIFIFIIPITKVLFQLSAVCVDQATTRKTST